MSDWLQIDFDCSFEEVEPLTLILEGLEAFAVTCKAASNQPDLFLEEIDQEVYWPQNTLQALFSSDLKAKEIVKTVSSLLPRYKGQISHQIIPDKDWVLEAKESFQPIQCDRLWIYPSWQKVPDKHQPAIKLNLGWGFGTGKHPTTSMCLSWVAKQEWQQKSMLDYGCGSGLLALGALVLGSKDVWATDIDEQALDASSQNYRLNGFSSKHSQIVLPDQLPKHKFDIVCANILLNPLLKLEPVLTALTERDGLLCLSGFYEQDIDELLVAYGHMTCQHIDIVDKWACIVLKA